MGKTKDGAFDFMSGRKGTSSNGSGCGTIIAVLLVIGFVSTYWYIIGIILAVVLVVYGYVIYRKRIELKNDSVSTNNIHQTVNNIHQTEKPTLIETKENDLVLSAGRYIAERDIPIGVYDVRLMDGYGYIKMEKPFSLHHYFSETSKSYSNLEISAETVLEVDGGLKIVLCNKEGYINQFGVSYKEEKDVIQKNIDVIDGHEFEDYCADVLRKQGYRNVYVTKGSGDQGVDVLAERDGIKYAVQCKRYSQPVGNKAVQEIYSGMKFYHCHVGIIMSNNFFTSSAKELAKENGIILWDRNYILKFHEQNIFLDKNINKNNTLINYNKTNNFSNSLYFDDTNKQDRKEEIKENINIKIQKEKKNMYDKEKGIYPPGVYVVGEDIEIGKYILTAQKGERKCPMVTFYENYSKYRKDEIIRFERFENDYYISLRENGMVIEVSDADMKKI